jgi:hypothetical protein
MGRRVVREVGFGFDNRPDTLNRSGLENADDAAQQITGHNPGIPTIKNPGQRCSYHNLTRFKASPAGEKTNEPLCSRIGGVCIPWSPGTPW